MRRLIWTLTPLTWLLSIGIVILIFLVSHISNIRLFPPHSPLLADSAVAVYSVVAVDSAVAVDSVVAVDSNAPDFSVSHILRRQDYSCGPGKPCSNGACCGKDGFCGYGTVYCGPGCTSNCNAVAECGKDANPPGKTCPLNTCCSEFGFCGSTKVRNAEFGDHSIPTLE